MKSIINHNVLDNSVVINPFFYPNASTYYEQA